MEASEEAAPETGSGIGGELHLERMSWPEVERALEDGWRSVVVAVGATEQHGPHLPLLVDAERGTRLAEGVARRLGQTLVAPTIRVGCSEHHMAFPGTLSLRRDTLAAVCRDYCTSLARHGFRRIFLVPSHGGNFGPLRHALDGLDEAAGPDCEVRAYLDLDGFLEVWRSAARDVLGLAGRVGGHADVAESSEMLVLRPDLVRPERAVAGYVGDVSGEVLDRLFETGIQALSENGVLGDARGLDAALGRACLERTADAVAEALMPE